MRARISLGFLARIRRGRTEDTGSEKRFAGSTWVCGANVEEVYAPGKWNSHLSDDVAAFALAHNAADRQAPPAAGEGVPKTSYVSRSQRELAYGPGEPALLAVGEVRMVEEGTNPYVIS